MIFLKRDERYEKNDIDCTYKVVFGNLIKAIKRIGYSTTFDNYDELITDEDIQDLYIYTCWNEDDNKMLVFISIREDWDLIYVGSKEGNYIGNEKVVSAMINAWINNN